MVEERRRAAAHVFVAPAALDAPSCTIEDLDRHHLERVLRLRPGQAVTASDGAGRWRPFRWTSGGALEATGPVVSEVAPQPLVVIGFALLKGDRNEWTVQKLTEVGVDRIVPFVTERSVVRHHAGSERALRQAERWRQVARGAAMQSRRVRLPVVEEVRPLAEVVASSALAAAACGGGGGGGGGVALAEPGGQALSLGHPVVLVGPEGGWAPAELGSGSSARALVDLGPTVLRGDTAALVAAAVLCTLRDRNTPPV